MKAINLVLCLSILVMTGCRKDNGKPEDQDPGSNKQLTDIVPQAYLDDVKKMGFPIYTGTNPPDISNDYRLAPWRYDARKAIESTSDVTLGSTNENGFVVSFSNQTATAITVLYEGYYAGFEKRKPFIMGSGNNFTVCRYVGMDACGANFRYNYMQLLSGTKEGNVLRNVKMATICLGTDNPAATCEMAGEISIHSDTDGVSNPT